VAASAVTLKSEFDVHEEEPPHALTIEEIEEIVERYASGAVRAAKAGFDGLEINAGADPPLPQPSFPASGTEGMTSTAPRAWRTGPAFLLISKRDQEEGGAGLPRPGAHERHRDRRGDEGFSIEEAKAVAKILEGVGVDSLHVRSHWAGMHQGSYHHDTLFYPATHIPIEQFPKDWTGAAGDLSPTCPSEPL
jgi:2,4-dienoyl-CoA reductase-like NADH-dependent reductase (Old Yellow Enzyme family)